MLEIDLLLFGGERKKKSVLKRGHSVPGEMKDALDVNTAALAPGQSPHVQAAHTCAQLIKKHTQKVRRHTGQGRTNCFMPPTAEM